MWQIGKVCPESMASLPALRKTGKVPLDPANYQPRFLSGRKQGGRYSKGEDPLRFEHPAFPFQIWQTSAKSILICVAKGRRAIRQLPGPSRCPALLRSEQGTFYSSWKGWVEWWPRHQERKVLSQRGGWQDAPRCSLRAANTWMGATWRRSEQQTLLRASAWSCAISWLLYNWFTPQHTSEMSTCDLQASFYSFVPEIPKVSQSRKYFREL